MSLFASARAWTSMGFVLIASIGQLPGIAGIADDVRGAVALGDFASADKLLSADISKRGISPDTLFAESWIARGLFDAGRIDEADKRAVEIRTRALTLLKTRKLDAGEALPLALGAAIEVHAQVLTKRGERAEATAYLRTEAIRWKGSSIQARIQKNLNILTLVGKPAPPLDLAHWAGPVRPQSLSALRGHPVLLFFWAHWCVDCKAEAPVIQDLLARYGSAGLKVVGPTMHYGFAGFGEEAPLAQEDSWIEQTRSKYYAGIGSMPVPVSETTLRLYGVSTTPTLVLIDSQGIVRLYHPGVMSYSELAPLVASLLARKAPLDL